MLKTMRILILATGWPILVAGSIYLFYRGRKVYSLVKGSLVGRITKTLVITMLVGMYSLGIIATAYMFADLKGVWWVAPVTLIWFITFIWTLRVLFRAQKEVQGDQSK